MLNCSASLPMSTSVLKAFPGKSDIKRHSPSILYFQNMVILHIKFKKMKGITTCKQIFCPYTHHRPVGGGKKRSKFSFSESGHFAYEIKGNEMYNNMQANILPLHTLDPWGGAKR